MIRRTLLACTALFGALFFFAGAPQSPAPDKTAEAARLNNIGVAYMNQQLFEKGLGQFQKAAVGRSGIVCGDG